MEGAAESAFGASCSVGAGVVDGLLGDVVFLLESFEDGLGAVVAFGSFVVLEDVLHGEIA